MSSNPSSRPSTVDDSFSTQSQIESSAHIDSVTTYDPSFPDELEHLSLKPLFRHFFQIVLTLTPVFCISLITLVETDSLPLNLAVTIVVCFVPSFGVISFVHSYVNCEDVANKANNLDSLQYLNAVFSYRWDYVTELDAKFIQSKILNQLKEFLEPEKASKSSDEDVTDPRKDMRFDVYWFFFYSLILSSVQLLPFVLLDEFFPSNHFSLMVIHLFS
ncbi:hypothetical protein GEMRC1_005075 [Eukaryota sp. GEM-RC1]